MNRPIELRRFFQELELATTPAVPERSLVSEPRELVLTPDHPNSFICGSTLVAFQSWVAPVHQLDALSSLLVAQLAANARAHPIRAPESWYREYGYHLGCFGWELEYLRLSEHASTHAQPALEQIILEVLGTVAPQRDLTLMARTLNALRSLAPTDERLALWAACSHYQNRGNLQVAVCHESRGQPIMRLAALYFECSYMITDLRISCFPGNSSLFEATADSVLLNKDIAAAVRRIVASRLGPAIPMFVRVLDI